MILSFAFVCEHEGSIGGYKGPTMFWPRPFEDFGSGLGEFRDFPGPQHLIWAFYVSIWALEHFGFYLSQFGTDLTWFYLSLNLF